MPEYAWSLFDRSLSLFDRFNKKRALRIFQRRVILLESRKLLAHFEIIDSGIQKKVSSGLLDWLSAIDLSGLESVVLNTEGFHVETVPVEESDGKNLMSENNQDLWTLVASVIVRISILKKIAEHLQHHTGKTNMGFQTTDFDLRIKRVRQQLLSIINKVNG